ncbi:HET-domain-containing protein, partial [Trichodelitschia bisporula]
EIHLNIEDARRLGAHGMFYGPDVPPRPDIEMLRPWLRSCEVEHGDGCARPGGVSVPIEEPRNLYAVDVQQRCVTPLAQGSRYLALSYCWPSGGRTLRLLRANHDDLHQPGGLDCHIDLMPKTLLDAIQLTANLSERYLWIDALCIIQDDSVHIASQIVQTGAVYGSAVATIVAAHPVDKGVPDLCTGLPRYGNPQPFVSRRRAIIKGLRLSVPAGNIEHVRGLTRWATRGWKYQEDLLSRRLLYFTPTQVYWQC